MRAGVKKVFELSALAISESQHPHALRVKDVTFHLKNPLAGCAY
jgi:hypothetical protein